MDARIERITSEIEARLGEPLDVASLAARVNLSASRFAHLFLEETGRSPMRYVHERRMERARVLLERTFLSVKQVMASVGCNDPSHFARDFRRHHGVPPREWRAALGGAQREPLGDAVGEAPGTSTDAQEQNPPTNSGFRQRTRGP